MAGQFVDGRGTHWASRWTLARRPVAFGPAGLKTILLIFELVAILENLVDFTYNIFFSNIGRSGWHPSGEWCAGSGSRPPNPNHGLWFAPQLTVMLFKLPSGPENHEWLTFCLGSHSKRKRGA